MSKVEVDQVTQQSGTTLTVGGGACKTAVVDATTVTLGRCGGTVSLASGATQSGFGRTGTVDWVTTPKTATFTAASGSGYFVNTTAGVITVNLPAGVAGSIVSLADYAATWQTYNVTVAPNGTDKIGSQNENATLNTEGQSVTFVYVDSTQGWINTMDSTSNVRGIAPFVIATGGTILTCGNFKNHVFTGPGTFCVSNAGTPAGSNTVDYFVVAGGGANGTSPNYFGGGGAGGFRVSNSVGCIAAPVMSPLANCSGVAVPVAPYSITVGAGGPGPAASPAGGYIGPSGSNSIFSSITSAGGGGGANTGVGGPGGSGGGGSQGPTPTSGYAGGVGNTPTVSPLQGYPGGAGYDGLAVNNNTGGGGGAGVAGTNAGPGTGGNGGVGSFIADGFVGPTAPSYGTPGPASSVRYFSGGGGGVSAPGVAGTGGAGGGGAGGMPGPGVAGLINTGGGAGGISTGGGSGIVMIRYKFQ